MKKQINVAYFPSNTEKNKVLGSNGKSLDNYCVKCEPCEDLSTGNYIVDLKFLITDNIQDLLREEVILKVLLDYGTEIFRISKITVGTRYIDVVARQITIADSLTLWLEDVRPTSMNGQAAATWLLDKSEGNKEIRIISDVDTVATAYYKRMSLYKALHDNENSFLNRWGGEIQRRGYTIYINKRIGIDRGFTIREGKNLTGFESASNIDSLITRARGQGYNEILGNYINSPLIGSYNRIYTSVIKYDDIKVKDEYSEEGYDTLEQAKAELDRRINEEFSKNDIDKIKAIYNINFVQLEKTEEYKNYIVAERLFIGDDSRVYIPKLNVDVKVRAMTKKYDVLAQKTKEIKLSNYIEVKPLSIKQIVEKLETIDSTESILQLAKDNATSLIKGGLKNSYVIVRENEIIIGDTKDINTMTNVWRWNSGGLGHSKTGYYGEFGTAITQDGSIVADFITTGQLNAALIKTGILMSMDGSSWINMDNGSLNFKDNLKVDSAGNVDVKGKIANESNDGKFGTYMDKGGLAFKCTSEMVAGIRSSRFDANEIINGLSIMLLDQGDYLDLGLAKGTDIETATKYSPIMRLTRFLNELTGNYLGVQFYENVLMKRALEFDSGAVEKHKIVPLTNYRLGLFGHDGVVLGYIKDGTNELSSVIALSENSDSNGCRVNIYGSTNFNGANIKNVANYYYSTGDIMGSVKGNATRVSNLNTFFESGWYACGSDCINTPEDWGVVHHFKAFSGDFAQWFHGTSNKFYIRWYVNNAWTAWKIW